MRVQLAKGESLLEALRRAQVHMDAPCNGQGTCGLCQVELYGLGKVKSCQFTNPGIYEVKLLKGAQYTSVKSEAYEYPWRKSFDWSKANVDDTIAVDLGTTTFAMAGLSSDISSDKEKAMWFDGGLNPQRTYGADVLSRIDAARRGDGVKLKELIQGKLLEKAAEHREQVIVNEGQAKTSLILAANTTMGHLLDGLDVQGLGKAPFTPVDISLHKGKLVDKLGEIYEVTYLPGISAFVGADIVSGLFALDIQKEEKPVLFLDLGTNGEMALGNKDRLLVTSTSAGPAFEASPLAMKIHASGLMALLRKALNQGIMDKTGLLKEPYFTQGFEGLEQALIRELQMAKAAIRAGIEILMKAYGVNACDISKVYLAGGMGYYLKPADAVAIGLIPKELESKCVAVGNSALEGAIRYAFSPEEAKAQMEKICDLAEEILLANDKSFDQEYIRYMNFDKNL